MLGAKEDWQLMMCLESVKMMTRTLSKVTITDYFKVNGRYDGVIILDNNDDSLSSKLPFLFSLVVFILILFQQWKVHSWWCAIVHQAPSVATNTHRNALPKNFCTSLKTNVLWWSVAIWLSINSNNLLNDFANHPPCSSAVIITHVDPKVGRFAKQWQKL